MKKLIITAALVASQIISHAQTKFTITFNQGFGQLPTFTKYKEADLLTTKQAEDAFNFIKNSVGIEWGYSYAGCEKRAHAASLFLKKKKVEHYKIWNFDPMMISLFNKSEKPTIISKAGLSPKISWGYHVAILVFVKDGKEIKPMVIDPALDDNLLTQEKWLDLQNSTTSYYTYLDSKWYNYATTDKFKYYCQGVAHPFPPCMDGLLTGDFFLNDDVSLTSMWIEEALAVNQLAMRLIREIINKEPANSYKKKIFTELVENFNNLTNALNGTNLNEDIKVYADILKPYQSEFITIKKNWKSKLDELRQ
ncbi:protein-glutamine glutaminase family protein [Flavobacterium sp.]|uniref:protein-glutamine glutaminase family protein n=1 Tax=Flavobacterium sp. TaxID=239 RepID=UPI004033C8A2